MSGILRIGALQDGAVETAVQTHPIANVEAELKLLAPAGALERLREAPTITRYARDTGSAHQLEAVYYDTPDRALFSNGLSLRVRWSGDGFIQTLKRGPTQGEPFVRAEWETEVAGTVPDLALLPADEIGALLNGLGSCVLGPVFATKVHRRTRLLDLPGAVVEVAFDDGVIEAGEQREPVSEVELELKAGDLRALYDLGLQLLEVAPLRLSTRNKSDRGYSLAFGVCPEFHEGFTSSHRPRPYHRRHHRRAAWQLPGSPAGEPGRGRGRVRPRGCPPDAGRTAADAYDFGAAAPTARLVHAGSLQR